MDNTTVKLSDITVKDFAEKHNIEPGMANAVLQFFKIKGSVEIIGSKQSESGKGKPSNIFRVPSKIEINT